MFQASTLVQVGNGARTLFRTDRWINGSLVANLAPDVLATMPKRANKTRSVLDGLSNNAWVRDISGSLSVVALAQYVSLWSTEFSLILHVMTSLSGNRRRISSILPPRPAGLSFVGNPLFWHQRAKQVASSAPL
jgi:hypothetical protein